MSMKLTLTSAALCLTFACFGSGAIAESGSGLEDAMIKADEAAEAEAKAAEAVAEGQAEKLKEAAEIQKEQTRGGPEEKTEVYGD